MRACVRVCWCICCLIDTSVIGAVVPNDKPRRCTETRIDHRWSVGGMRARAAGRQAQRAQSIHILCCVACSHVRSTPHYYPHTCAHTTIIIVYNAIAVGPVGHSVYICDCCASLWLCTSRSALLACIHVCNICTYCFEQISIHVICINIPHSMCRRAAQTRFVMCAGVRSGDECVCVCRVSCVCLSCVTCAMMS